MSEPAQDTSHSTVTLRVNGTARTLDVRNDETLLETLRREFALHSVRGTCGIGICGTCTVLVDGQVASACLLLTVMAEQRDIITCEGLLDDSGELSAVQQAFVEHGAYQCSFCIPAMVLTVHNFLEEQSAAELDQLREHLGGNLCRCGTYPQIVEAAAALLDANGGSADE